MRKHLLTHVSNPIQTLKTLTKTPHFKTPISHFHNPHKSPQFSNPAIDFILNEVEDLQSSKPAVNNTPDHDPPLRESVSKEVEISHHWPEWVEFIEHLLKKGYFEEVGCAPFDKGELGAKDANRIRSACLKFARHRFDLIR